MSRKAFGFHGNRNKYNARKTEIDGIKFDSLAEGEMYQLLKRDPEVRHIDCHVPVTLPGGVRLNIDFIVHKFGHMAKTTRLEQNGEITHFHDWQIEAIEVKGKATPDFKTKRKLFDQFHPLAPLKVYRKTGKRWESI